MRSASFRYRITSISRHTYVNSPATREPTGTAHIGRQDDELLSEASGARCDRARHDDRAIHPGRARQAQLGGHVQRRAHLGRTLDGHDRAQRDRGRNLRVRVPRGELLDGRCARRPPGRRAGRRHNRFEVDRAPIEPAQPLLTTSEASEAPDNAFVCFLEAVSVQPAGAIDGLGIEFP